MKRTNISCLVRSYFSSSIGTKMYAFITIFFFFFHFVKIGNNLETDETRLNIKENAVGLNGNCSKVQDNDSPAQEVPLLNMIRKQNRPNSL